MFLKLAKTLVFTAVFFSISAVAVMAADYSVNVSNASNGVVSVTAGQTAKKVKVRIEKDGTTYQYDMSTTNINQFPLQMGNGTYTIGVFENIEGDKYRPVANQTVTVSGLTAEKLYTNPIQNIDFNGSMASIKAMNALADPSASNVQKLEAYYNHIINNISYDYDKVSVVTSTTGYLPVIDTVYANKKGICFDYSALLASILRYNGIPAKLQMGYSNQIPGEYHAWNDVYIDGAWYKIDTTIDAQANKAGVSFTMKKNSGDFTVVKEY